MIPDWKALQALLSLSMIILELRDGSRESIMQFEDDFKKVIVNSYVVILKWQGTNKEYLEMKDDVLKSIHLLKSFYPTVEEDLNKLMIDKHI